MDKIRLGKKHVAGDIRKIANVDLAIGISTDKEDAREDVFHMWIVASRSTHEECGCVIQTAIDVGKLCTASWIKLKDKKEEPTNTDKKGVYQPEGANEMVKD